MIINNDAGLLNPSVAGAGSSSAAASRSGNWMAELERALIAEQPVQKPADTPERNAANRGVPQAPEENAMPERDERDSMRDQTVRQYVAPGTQPANNKAGMQTAAQTHAENAQIAGAAPKATMPRAQFAPQGATPAARVATNSAKAAPQRAKDASQADGQSPMAAVPIAGVPVQLETALSVALRSYAVAAPAADAVEQAGASVPSASRAPAAGQATLGSVDVAESDDGLSELQPEGNTEEVPTSSAEPYKGQHMHLVQDGDLVSVWIRDAGLSQPQAVLVAQSLGSELHQSGLKLNGLMVNGKKVSSLFQGNQYQNQDVFDAEERHGEQPAQSAQASSIDQRGEV